MKKILAVLLPLTLFAAAAFAFDNDDSVVRWNSFSGVITAPGVDNPIGTIHGGAGPWSAHSGRARVNLATGAATFEVEGLVLNGGNSSGTPGGVNSVAGTLVCASGSATPVILDTTAVPLSVHGDARFFGQLSGVPSACANPLFLIRIASSTGVAGRWIATGTERFIGDDGR